MQQKLGKAMGLSRNDRTGDWSQRDGIIRLWQRLPTPKQTGRLEYLSFSPHPAFVLSLLPIPSFIFFATFFSFSPVFPSLLSLPFLPPFPFPSSLLSFLLPLYPPYLLSLSLFFLLIFTLSLPGLIYFSVQYILKIWDFLTHLNKSLRNTCHLGRFRLCPFSHSWFIFWT